ncbi:MAG: adenosylcobinamide-GDP ribazoletransferase [Planctomycetes bacterium]|nr:adenosylcobinamide-GDP ribazoletransferase [Planctomycetota bacterium]
MKTFLAALRFLTVVPLPGKWGTAEEDLGRSVVFFPAVGLLAGAAAAALACGLLALLPQAPASALIVIGLVAVSGGLHLDGLSDTADGFFSSRPRKRILEIMKDSHIGAMGVIAIVSVMLLKVAALASMPAEHVWRAVFMMPIAGRCALVITIGLLPYARPEGGLAAIFYRKRSGLDILRASLLLCVAGWFIAGVEGLAAGAGSIFVTLAFAAYTYRKTGGATGDTLGAACEIVETAPALVMCGWYFYN